MRRTSRTNRSRAPRRKLIWVHAAPTGTVQVGAGGAAVAPVQTDMLSQFQTAYGAELVGCTIMRTRGVLQFARPGIANNVVTIRATMHIVDQAEAVRATVANDNAFNPGTAANLDYMMFEPFSVCQAAAFDNGSAVSNRVVDVKAARRLPELNQTLVFRVSAIGTQAADAVQWNADFSLLVALP